MTEFNNLHVSLRTKRNFGQVISCSVLWDRYWGQNKKGGETRSQGPFSYMVPSNDHTTDCEVSIAPDLSPDVKLAFFRKLV